MLSKFPDCAQGSKRWHKNSMKTQDTGDVLNTKVVYLPLVKIISKIQIKTPKYDSYRASALKQDEKWLKMASMEALLQFWLGAQQRLPQGPTLVKKKVKKSSNILCETSGK